MSGSFLGELLAGQAGNRVLKYRESLLFGLLIWGMGAAFATAAPIKIVAFGDSLMASYQLAAEQGFPARLAKALAAKGLEVEMTDAAVSGDTTSGGLERLDWSVPDGTDFVILELGGNDALRGSPPEAAEANLEAMIGKLKARNIKIILAGMLAPPNMGKAYEEAFNGVFPKLAKEHHLPLIPFFLEGVAGVPELQLEDRMHPNPKGVEKMVENALPVILEAVSKPSQ
jgi:acyl-CoA thioesterase I